MPKRKITKFLPLYIGPKSVMVRQETGKFDKLSEFDVEGVAGLCKCGCLDIGEPPEAIGTQAPKRKPRKAKTEKPDPAEALKDRLNGDEESDDAKS